MSGRAKEIANGPIPRWATTILLGITVWLGNRYASAIEENLRTLNSRVLAVEISIAELKGVTKPPTKGTQ